MAKRITFSLSVENDEKAKVLQALLKTYNPDKKSHKVNKGRK